MEPTFDSDRLSTKETALARGWLCGMVETLVWLEEKPSEESVAEPLSVWLVGPCGGDVGLANVLMGLVWGEFDPDHPGHRRRLDVLEALWRAAHEGGVYERVRQRTATVQDGR